MATDIPNELTDEELHDLGVKASLVSTEEFDPATAAPEELSITDPLTGETTTVAQYAENHKGDQEEAAAKAADTVTTVDLGSDTGVTNAPKPASSSTSTGTSSTGSSSSSTGSTSTDSGSSASK